MVAIGGEVKDVEVEVGVGEEGSGKSELSKKVRGVENQA